MRNLERAIRLFRALVETDESVQVTSSTMWSWHDTEKALQGNPDAGALLVEMRGLPPAVRERTLHYCGSFEPLEARGDVFVFPDNKSTQAFITEMEADGSVVDHLADLIVAAHCETLDYVVEVAGKHGGTPWVGPALDDAFEHVDTDLPYAMIVDGVPPVEMEEALVTALWKDRETALSETFLTSNVRTATERFRGRLAQWATARTVLGVEPRLFEALRSSGVLPDHICLLVEQVPGAPAPTAGAPGVAAGPPDDRGGVAKDQPEPGAGMPAQSGQDTPKEPPKPTEHVPTQEEGGASAITQVKLPDGTVVPPDIMRKAVASIFKELATQFEQGTTGGQPAPKPDQEAGKPQGQPEEQPEEQPEPPQPEPPQQQQQATPPQQGQATPGEQAQRNPGRVESYRIHEDLNRALGMILSPRTRDVIAGIGLVQETGFSGQPQQVVERVLDELNTLQASPNARVRRAARGAMEADLYRTESAVIPFLPNGLSYGDGRSCAAGTQVTIIEDRGKHVVIRLPTGETVLAPASAVSLSEGGRGTTPQNFPGLHPDPKDVKAARKRVAAKHAARKARKVKRKDELFLGKIEGNLHEAPVMVQYWTRKILEVTQRHNRHISHWTVRIKRLVMGGEIDEAVNVLVGAFGLKPLPHDVQAVLDEWEAQQNESMDEQLDVGQEDEQDSTARGFQTTAAKLKTCRQHTFDLVTKDFVQLESTAQAVGAKRTVKLLAATRAKATEFLDALKETAELLDKANEAFKGESGGKGGDTVDQQQQMQVAGAAPVIPAGPVAPVVPGAPAPVAAVGEAVKRIAGTGIPRRIAEGEVYMDIVEAINLQTSDLGLNAQQIGEVYDRFNRVVLSQDGGEPDYQVEFSSTDHRLLESVQRHGSRLRGLVARSASRRQTFATRDELAEAVSTLRKHGKVEHEMLADDLAAIVSRRC